MAMEVVCGNCQGRLLVEHTGVVVACPHCGAHLQIGDPTPPAAAVPLPIDLTPVPPAAPPAAFTAPDFGTPPSPFVPPAPAPVATPEVSPFPFSFEPPAVAASQAEPEPLFPEIILTPAPVTPPAPPPAVTPTPAMTPTPVVAVTPDPVAAPAWEPPPQMAPPAAEVAPDSWMPQINLEMPPAAAAPPPAEPAPTPPAPPLAEPETATTLTPAMPVVDTSPSTVNLAVAAPTGNPAHQTDIWNPTRVENPRAPEPIMAFPGPEPSFAGFGNFSPDTAVIAAAPTITTTPVQSPAPALGASFATSPAQPAASPAATGAGPEIVTSNARREATVPRLLFVIVASYASAITLAFLYVWSRGGASDPLDLPDIRPAFNKATGQYGLRLRDETPLPSAFRLKLGQSKRYGNVMVTPLKVTKGPLEFVHFSDEKLGKPGTKTPVLKLWVKFENVSADQTFPALDEELLFRRVRDRDNAEQDRSNNYLCLKSEQKRKGKHIPVYTFPIKGDWLLKGQKLETELAPQESWETYIPSNDEDLSDLQGPLCWRVQFRKGYNPQSKRGVTTLVEVEFDSKDIQVDS